MAISKTKPISMGGSKKVTNSEKVLKWWGKKDISSNLVWNPLTMSMTMSITMGGSKNVKNSKIVGRKDIFSKLVIFTMTMTITMTIGGSKNVTNGPIEDLGTTCPSF